MCVCGGGGAVSTACRNIVIKTNVAGGGPGVGGFGVYQNRGVIWLIPMSLLYRSHPRAQSLLGMFLYTFCFFASMGTKQRL